MTEQDKISEAGQDGLKTAETTSQETPCRHEAKRFVWLAIVSILLTVGAWIAGTFNGIAAIAVSAAAIVAGAMALKSRRNAVRNTAITSIIAAAVLLVVVAAFLIVIYAGMKAM